MHEARSAFKTFPFLQLLLEEVEEWLDNLDGVTTVHAPFYDLSSRYYMVSVGS